MFVLLYSGGRRHEAVAPKLIEETTEKAATQLRCPLPDYFAGEDDLDDDADESYVPAGEDDEDDIDEEWMTGDEDDEDVSEEQPQLDEEQPQAWMGGSNPAPLRPSVYETCLTAVVVEHTVGCMSMTCIPRVLQPER